MLKTKRAEELDCLRKNCCGPIAREALNRMMSAAVKVAGGAPQRDDMTLTVIRVLAGPMLSISIGKIFRG